MHDLGESIDGLVGPEISRARRVLLSIGHDTYRAPGFWEGWLATMLGGSVTDHKSTHDVDVEIWGRACAIECKFSGEFFMNYLPIRGKDWSRWVFKWALPRGQSGKHSADAIVLIGVTTDDRAYAWSVPREAISATCASITIATHRSRTAGTFGPFDRYATPFSDILPAVARTCHNTHDMPARRAGIRERKRAHTADLFA